MRTPPLQKYFSPLRLGVRIVFDPNGFYVQEPRLDPVLSANSCRTKLGWKGTSSQKPDVSGSMLASSTHTHTHTPISSTLPRTLLRIGIVIDLSRSAPSITRHDTGVSEKTLLQMRRHVGMLAWRAPNQRLESSFCCQIAGQGLAQKTYFSFRRHQRIELRLHDLMTGAVRRFARQLGSCEHRFNGGLARHCMI